MPLNSSKRKQTKPSKHPPNPAPSPTLQPQTSTAHQHSSRPHPPSTRSSNAAAKTTMRSQAHSPARPSAHLASHEHCRSKCRLLRTFLCSREGRNRSRRSSTTTRSTCTRLRSKPRRRLRCPDTVGAWIGAGRARLCIIAPSRGRSSRGVRIRVP